MWWRVKSSLMLTINVYTKEMYDAAEGARVVALVWSIKRKMGLLSHEVYTSRKQS
jgi:hypothetical protein